MFQLENGISHAKEDGRRTGFDMLGRIGLKPNLELRIGAEPVVRLENGDDETGFGDVELAAKYRMLDATDTAPAVAFLPFVKLATANDPIGSEETDFGVALILSQSLPWDLAADFNIGVAAIGQTDDGDYRGQGFTSLAIGRTFGENLTAYGEVFYRTKEERDGPRFLGADVGVIYLVTNRVAVDFAVEGGLNSGADDYAVRGGITFLLGDAR